LQYQEEAESLEEDLLLGYFEICIAFLYEMTLGFTPPLRRGREGWG